MSVAQLDRMLRGIKDRRVRRVVELIRADPLRDACDYARQVGLSESRLAHLFKQHARLSLGRFIKTERMRVARERLITTGARIKEVAKKIRYGHPQNFTRAFARITGRLPVRVRNGVGY